MILKPDLSSNSPFARSNKRCALLPLRGVSPFSAATGGRMFANIIVLFLDIFSSTENES